MDVHYQATGNLLPSTMYVQYNGCACNVSTHQHEQGSEHTTKEPAGSTHTQWDSVIHTNITRMCKHNHKAFNLHTQPLQPEASYTQGLQLRSEDSSLPLNHATLILRTCRLAAFHFMQLRLKALLISAKLESQLGKHFVPAAR